MKYCHYIFKNELIQIYKILIVYFKNGKTRIRIAFIMNYISFMQYVICV